MDKGEGAEEATGEQPGSGQLTEEAAASKKLFCCGWMRRLVPLEYREELYHLLCMTGPLLISRILDFLLPFAITVAAGHLGNEELAGYALASAIINITIRPTGFGLAIGCDTLISQTFGSKNLKRIGEILQRAILILLIACLPVWAIIINTETILLALWQEPDVARISQFYMLAFLPAVPAMFLHALLVSYLQNQGIILPMMYTGAVANVINAGLNYLLIYGMNLGVYGSAAASSLAQVVLCLLLYGYIRWKKLHLKTWGGWSSAALQDWGSYMQLAVPGTLMTYFEWWTYEVGGFLAGSLGKKELAAQHVLLEISSIAFMIPLGIQVAVTVRVGNALGAGDEKGALRTCKVGLAVSAAQALIQGTVLAATKNVIGYIFTNDMEIIEVVSRNIFIFILLQFFDGLVVVCAGILVGSGKQKIAAVLNLINYYCIGLPLGYALMFYAELRITGLWLGLLICTIVQVCVLITVIFKLDWRKVRAEAQRRVGQKPCINDQEMEETVRLKASAGQEKNIDGGEIERAGGTQMEAAGEDSTNENGYSAVGTQDHETVSENDEKGFSKDDQTTIGADVQRQSEDGDKEGEDGTTTATTAMPKKPTILSVTQLVLRRGLVLLTAILVLVAGVMFHLQFPTEHLRMLAANRTLEFSNTTTAMPLITTTLPQSTSAL